MLLLLAGVFPHSLLPLKTTLLNSKNYLRSSLDRAGLRGLDVVRLGAVDEHARDLDLAVGVEGDQADVGLGEGLGRRLDLLEDLRRVGAAEHGQLVHRPVAVVLVAGGGLHADRVLVGDVGVLRVGELERRDPAVAGDVVDLLGDVGVRERGQVGEGLEEPERLVGGRSRRRRTRIGGEEIEEREGRGERGERREREREKESEEERRRRREGGD